MFSSLLGQWLPWHPNLNPPHRLLLCEMMENWHFSSLSEKLQNKKNRLGKGKKKKKKSYTHLEQQLLKPWSFHQIEERRKILLDDQAEFSPPMVKLRLVLPAICASICALFVCLFVFQFDYDRLFRTWILQRQKYSTDLDGWDLPC